MEVSVWVVQGACSQAFVVRATLLLVQTSFELQKGGVGRGREVAEQFSPRWVVRVLYGRQQKGAPEQGANSKTLS